MRKAKFDFMITVLWVSLIHLQIDPNFDTCSSVHLVRSDEKCCKILRASHDEEQERLLAVNNRQIEMNTSAMQEEGGKC